ncbi:MAG: AI-2E family transporter [Deltaproteobacteria bacterium]|nr:AI-2E family transporter [Deltaproteobacteria bacterium]
MSLPPGVPPKRNQFVKHLLLTLLFVGAALLIWQTLQIFLLIFAGVIFAVFLKRTGLWISKNTRLSVHLSVSVVVFFLLAFSVLLGSAMAPRIRDQVDRFSKQFPEALSQVEERVSDYALGEWFVNGMTNKISGSVVDVDLFVIGAKMSKQSLRRWSVDPARCRDPRPSARFL